jgi:hypothetical protein
VFDETRPVDLDDVDTYLTGRAFADTLFINPLVSFRIGPFNPIVAITDSTVALLNFSILNRFEPLVLDTSTASVSLPASILFSQQRDQLFLADLQRGVQRIVFSPLSIIQTFE